jgi:hypothetical protein
MVLYTDRYSKFQNPSRLLSHFLGNEHKHLLPGAVRRVSGWPYIMGAAGMLGTEGPGPMATVPPGVLVPQTGPLLPCPAVGRSRAWLKRGSSQQAQSNLCATYRMGTVLPRSLP